jgi:hypothetical protein
MSVDRNLLLYGLPYEINSRLRYDALLDSTKAQRARTYAGSATCCRRSKGSAR